MLDNTLPADPIDEATLFMSKLQQQRELEALPPATEFLNFTGDQSHTIGEPKGPNLNGEWLTVVSCDYDPDSNKSHVGLAYGYITIRQGETREHEDQQ